MYFLCFVNMFWGLSTLFIFIYIKESDEPQTVQGLIKIKWVVENMNKSNLVKCVLN